MLTYVLYTYLYHVTIHRGQWHHHILYGGGAAYFCCGSDGWRHTEDARLPSERTDSRLPVCWLQLLHHQVGTVHARGGGAKSKVPVFRMRRSDSVELLCGQNHNKLLTLFQGFRVLFQSTAGKLLRLQLWVDGSAVVHVPQDWTQIR